MLFYNIISLDLVIVLVASQVCDSKTKYKFWFYWSTRNCNLLLRIKMRYSGKHN